jgi:hypothetical protein
LLPVVTTDTGQAICRELESSEDNSYVVALLSRLERENPCIAEFISRLAIQHEDPMAVTTAAVLVYRLLESQCEANALRAHLEMG